MVENQALEPGCLALNPDSLAAKSLARHLTFVCNLYKKGMIEHALVVGLGGLKHYTDLFVSSLVHSFNIQCSIKLTLISQPYHLFPFTF